MRRRSSIIAPLILILLGTLFLMRNFWPEVRVGDLIAAYWPYVLIVWGFLRLFEIASWAAQSKPLPSNGISGGEWVLVIFLCIFGSAFHAVHHRDFWFGNNRAFRTFISGWGQRFDYTLDVLEKSSGAAPRVIIDNLSGDARITGADITDVKVVAHKSIRSFRQPDADRANRETPVELIQQGDQFTVRTNQERLQDDLEMSTDLEITVPNGASVITHGRQGDVTVTDLGGSVDISSDSAGVRLQNIGGSVRVELRRSSIVRAVAVKGSVDLKGFGDDLELQDIGGQVTVNGTYAGQVDFRRLAKLLRFQGSTLNLNLEQVPGEVRYEPGELTATNIVGPVRLDGRSTNVRLIGFTQRLDLRLSGTGDLDLRPGGAALPAMDVHTNSGNIDLTLPPAAQFDLKMMTERGEAQDQYGPPLKVDRERHSAILSGAEGGGPQLRLITSRGQITVRKASDDTDADLRRAPPRPPAPPERF